MIGDGMLRGPRKPCVANFFFSIAFLGGLRMWRKKRNSASEQNNLLLEEPLFLSCPRYAD
jgi:hypothetical protein